MNGAVDALARRLHSAWGPSSPQSHPSLWSPSALATEIALHFAPAGAGATVAELLERAAAEGLTVDALRAELRALALEAIRTGELPEDGEELRLFHCAVCGAPFTPGKTGPMPRFCRKHRHPSSRPKPLPELDGRELERRLAGPPSPGPVGARKDARSPAPDWRAFLGEARPLRDIDMRELAARYLEQLEEQRSPSAADARSFVVRHLDRAFGAMSPHELRPEVLAAWIASLRAAGYAENTSRKHVAMLSAILGFGIAIGAAPSINPVLLLPRGVRPAKKPRDPDRSIAELLTPADTARLIGSPSIPLERRALWAVLLLTGARIGEASGLEWSDWDPGVLPLGRLRIARQFRTKGRVIAPTKSDVTRMVPVHPRLAEILKALRQWFEGAFGRPPAADDPLVPRVTRVGWRVQESGHRDVFRICGPRRWIQPQALRFFQEDLAAAEVPPPTHRKIHACRHSFITNLVVAGAPDRIVRTLTHTSGITDRRDVFASYVHAPWPARCAAVLRLDLPEVE